MKGPLGCSVVRFKKNVYVLDEMATVEIYESGLSMLHYIHSRNAEINCKLICKEVDVDRDDDILYLNEEDYHVTMIASSEDTLTAEERLERDLDHEENIQDDPPSLPKRRSSRKRNYAFTC